MDLWTDGRTDGLYGMGNKLRGGGGPGGCCVRELVGFSRPCTSERREGARHQKYVAFVTRRPLLPRRHCHP